MDAAQDSYILYPCSTLDFQVGGEDHGLILEDKRMAVFKESIGFLFKDMFWFVRKELSS